MLLSRPCSSFCWLCFAFIAPHHMASLIFSQHVLKNLSHHSFFSSPDPPLSTVMMWRMRCRSRTICLSLAFVTVFLHLLLALVSLPTYNEPCDPPLPPRTHILRDLARNDYTSVGISGPAEPPTLRDSSDKDANKDAKGHVETLSGVGVSVKEAKYDSMDMPVNVGRYGTNRAAPVESGLSKLEALFDHPLYNMPTPPIPEEDWLLKVKPKVKASEKSSQMWSVILLLSFS